MSAKTAFLRLAGSQLGGFLDDALRIGGVVGEKAATGLLKAGKSQFAPDLVGKVGKEVPMLLREGSRAVVPSAGRLLGKGAVVGTGLAAVGMLDQQSEYSQPMPGMTGNKEMDQFLMKQQLVQQQFENEMRLTYAREEARIPGKQLDTRLGAYQASTKVSPLDIAKAEREMVEAGEATNREALGVARSIYGTGLRAY